MEQIFILKEELKGIKEAGDIFKKILRFKIDYTQENLILFCLDVRLKVVHAEIMFKGGLDSCVIDPITIFRKALLKNSHSLIIAHNHPSGNLTPSTSDFEIHRKIKDGGKLLNIKVLDSIVFNKKEFYSMEGKEE